MTSIQSIERWCLRDVDFDISGSMHWKLWNQNLILLIKSFAAFFFSPYMTSYKRLIIAWLQKMFREREILNVILINQWFKSLYSTMELVFWWSRAKVRVYYLNTLQQRTNFYRGPWSSLKGLIVITDADRERRDS